MRLDIVNHSSHPDAPVTEMFNLVGGHLYALCARWPGARQVVADLVDQRFYLELVDDLPEAPGALGYHDVDGHGTPYAKVAVNPSLQNGSDWLTGRYSVLSVIEHEADETTLNPIINVWRDLGDGTRETAQEACDAVEDTGYHWRGADQTNFLLPAWFNPFGVAPFDHLGVLAAPFTLSPGGYMIVRSPGGESQQWAKEAVYGADYPDWRRALHTRGARLLG